MAHLSVDEILLLLWLLVLGVILGILRRLPLSLSVSLRASLVELSQNLGWNTVEQLFRIDTEKSPGLIQRLVDSSRLVWRLGDESALELLQELEDKLSLE